MPAVRPVTLKDVYCCWVTWRTEAIVGSAIINEKGPLYSSAVQVIPMDSPILTSTGAGVQSTGDGVGMMMTTMPLPPLDVGAGVGDVVTGGGVCVGTLVGAIEGAGVGCTLLCGMTNNAR